MKTISKRLASWLALAAFLHPGPSLALAAANGATLTLVDIATDDTDPMNLDDSEPSIAVNPINPDEIAVVAFSERWSSSARAPVWKSSDGGASWRKVFQIPIPRAGLIGPDDQRIAFDANGSLFVAEQGAGGTPRNFIYSQMAGPDDPLTVGGAFGDDQVQIDIDNSAASACFSMIYSSWLNFGLNPEKSMLTRSADSGVTVLSLRLGTSAAFANRSTRTAVGPDGRAYAIYKTREGSTGGGFENVHFRIHRSDDCGSSWDALGPDGVPVHGPDPVQSWFTSSWGNPARGKTGRARSSDDWIAVNPADGAVYAAYVSKDDSTFGQIYVARSEDLGMTWSSARVTDGTHHSAYPEIAVAANGTVGVLYVDYDDSGPRNVFRHRFARSFDNGSTWMDELLQELEPTTIANARSGFLWGDYNGLTALGTRFYGVFTGESVGRTLRQMDPIFFSETALPPE